MSSKNTIISSLSLVNLILSLFSLTAIFSNVSVSAITPVAPIPSPVVLKKTKATTIFNISNNTINVNPSQTKTITSSDLKYGSLSFDADYSISPFKKGKKERIYVSLNGYPASTICVDGSKYNEQASGSGLFNLSKVSPQSGQNYKFWTPDYFGSCDQFPPDKDILKFNFNKSDSFEIFITTTALSDKDIYFNVKSLPLSAEILVDGLPIISSKDVFREFTQQDINDGKISLKANIVTPTSDSFTFNVSDRYYNITNEVFNFNILNQGAGTTLFLQANTSPSITNPIQNPQPASTQNTETQSGDVLGVIEESADQFYAYGLKATGIRADKLIDLSTVLNLAKTSGARNSNFSFTLSNIVRIDPKLKDLTCELARLSDGQIFAKGQVDENGKCIINWTPGSSTPRGRFSGLIKIVDSSRDHTYVTNTFNLNLI